MSSTTYPAKRKTAEYIKPDEWETARTLYEVGNSGTRTISKKLAEMGIKISEQHLRRRAAADNWIKGLRRGKIMTAAAEDKVTERQIRADRKSKGEDDSAPVDPDEIFDAAIQANSSIIEAHQRQWQELEIVRLRAQHLAVKGSKLKEWHEIEVARSANAEHWARQQKKDKSKIGRDAPPLPADWYIEDPQALKIAIRVLAYVDDATKVLGQKQRTERIAHGLNDNDDGVSFEESLERIFEHQLPRG